MTAYLQQLFSFEFYKRTQGKIARQGTFFALALAVAVGAYQLKNLMEGYEASLPIAPVQEAGQTQEQYDAAVQTYETELDAARRWTEGVHTAAAPTMFAVFLLGCWAAFRLIQLPVFADFLISVEAEMNKVTWPKRGELWRASMVVILTIFVLAGLLYAYDFIWSTLLNAILSIGR